MNKKIAFFSLIIILTMFVSACGGLASENRLPLAQGNAAPVPASTFPVDVLPSNPPVSSSAPIPTPTSAPTAQSNSQSQGVYGPQIENFPAGINPLTGLPVADPSLLNLPAVMVSIPLFPASARPQAGLSYAPWIFEIYIGEGTTRLLTTFYGETPSVEPAVTGSCEVRTTPFQNNGSVIGNRTWIDTNRNGIQDSNELGIGGICVKLYDTAGNLLQTTSTDSNGYYGFNVEPGQTYVVGFEKPAGLNFTTPNTGYNDQDSDADPSTGLTQPNLFTASDMNWDAGYIPVDSSTASTDTTGQDSSTAVAGPTGQQSSNTTSTSAGIANDLTALPPAEVGPIRSMRLPYGRIGSFFQGGCIVSASGDPSVLAKVPGCKYVFGDDSSVNNALLNITDLQTLAEGNKKNYEINYSGNAFNPVSPAGGQPASEVDAFWNWADQSQFRYDPLSGAYLRFANRPGEEGTFTPQTDRLTGRQLAYDNVIVMYVEHTATAETLIDINLAIGQMGRADLFRNGQVYHIYWSTVAQAYEQQTQRLRPIRFTDAKGNPFALAPGHTWVHVFTPASVLYEKQPGSGIWTAEFHAPLINK